MKAAGWNRTTSLQYRNVLGLAPRCASGVIEQAEATHLMSIARTTDPLSTQQVSDALNKVGG